MTRASHGRDEARDTRCWCLRTNAKSLPQWARHWRPDPHSLAAVEAARGDPSFLLAVEDYELRERQHEHSGKYRVENQYLDRERHKVDQITMTAKERESIERELGQLETTGRREVAGRIKTAREWGDLKENAEYHAAKEEQARLETRIAKLREQLRSAVVLEVPASGARVQHGSTVSYTDRSTNRQHTFRIVAPHEARPSDGALSSASPVARALIGRGIGDEIEVPTPKGVRKLRVDSLT